MANETPTLSSKEKDLHDWCMTVVEDGTARRRAWEGVWWENIATYGGDLWVEWDVHKRRLFEPRKPDHKVRVPINLAQPPVRTELAKLTKNRPIVDCIPDSDDRTHLNAAEVGNKMLNNYAEKQFHMPRVRRRGLMWVLVCGYGGIFVDWDPEAQAKVEVLQNPEGEPVFEERVIEAYKAYYKKKKQDPKTMTVPMGEMVIKPVSPFQVIFDFSQLFIEDAWWCVYSDVMDVNDVKRRWNVDVEGEKEAMPGVMERRLLLKMNINREISMEDPKSQQMVAVHRMFVRPGHPYFPQGAHIVYTKNEIIHKENFPYDHNELPISMMGHIPFPISQYSMSILQSIKPVVLELSKTESQMIENRNLMANPPWRIAKQHRIEMEIQNRPGLRLIYNHVPNVPPPEPVQMPDLAGYVKDLVPMLKDHVLEISGQGETSQGRIPAGARSGVAVAYLQEEDDTRLGPTVEEYEEMIERVASQMLSVMASEYDTPRTVRIFRKHGDPEVFDFIGTMLEGVSGVQVQAGSALPRSKAAKQQFILDLWDRKLEQDPRRVRDMLELSSGEPDEWEIDINQADRENRKMQQGQEVQVEDWHNHLAHLYKHHNFMKSADFDALDENAKEIFREHCDEHQREVDAQQQQQMASQAQAGQLGAGPGGPSQGGPPSPLSANGAGNGVTTPEGPPPQFSAESSPRDLLDQGPQ